MLLLATVMPEYWISHVICMHVPENSLWRTRIGDRLILAVNRHFTSGQMMCRMRSCLLTIEGLNAGARQHNEERDYCRLPSARLVKAPAPRAIRSCHLLIDDCHLHYVIACTGAHVHQCYHAMAPSVMQQAHRCCARKPCRTSPVFTKVLEA